MKHDNKVIITHGKGPFKNAKEALGSLDLNFLKGKSILIKPNIGRSTSKEKMGINAHPEAIAGAIEVLQEAQAHHERDQSEPRSAIPSWPTRISVRPPVDVSPSPGEYRKHAPPVRPP